MPQAPSRADLCLGQRACSGLSGAGVTRGPAAPGALRVFCQRQTGPRASSPGSQGPPPPVLVRSSASSWRPGCHPQDDLLQVAAEIGTHGLPCPRCQPLPLKEHGRTLPCLVHAQWGPCLARASRESPSVAARVPPRYLLGGRGHVGAGPGGGPSRVGTALGFLALGGRLWVRTPPTPAMPGPHPGHVFQDPCLEGLLGHEGDAGPL